MKAVQSFSQWRLSMSRFVVVCMVAVLLGLVMGAANAQRLENHITYSFVDGNRAFCADQGRLDVGESLFEAEPVAAFKTPEEAVDDFVTHLHLAASGALLDEGESLPDGILALLEPSRQFYVSERLDMDQELVYFDRPSAKKDVLEARLVVERLGEGYHVTESYICEAMLVSDPAALEQIWAEEMSHHENQ